MKHINDNIHKLIPIDEDILKAGREYAKKHHISFNALIRRLIKQTIQKESGQ